LQDLTAKTNETLWNLDGAYADRDKISDKMYQQLLDTLQPAYERARIVQAKVSAWREHAHTVLQIVEKAKAKDRDRDEYNALSQEWEEAMQLLQDCGLSELLNMQPTIKPDAPTNNTHIILLCVFIVFCITIALSSVLVYLFVWRRRHRRKRLLS
jgi:hypothetical protein